MTEDITEDMTKSLRQNQTKSLNAFSNSSRTSSLKKFPKVYLLPLARTAAIIGYRTRFLCEPARKRAQISTGRPPCKWLDRACTLCFQNRCPRHKKGTVDDSAWTSLLKKLPQAVQSRIHRQHIRVLHLRQKWISAVVSTEFSQWSSTEDGTLFKLARIIQVCVMPCILCRRFDRL